MENDKGVGEGEKKSNFNVPFCGKNWGFYFQHLMQPLVFVLSLLNNLKVNKDPKRMHPRSGGGGL